MDRWGSKGRWVKHDNNGGCLMTLFLGLLFLCAFPILIPIILLGGLGTWWCNK